MSAECCYCGQPATTRDHVPTRKLFPQPRPSDLITVPACSACNNTGSLDEEYFIHVILSHRQADSTAARTLRKQLFAKTANARRVRMARRMLSAVGSAPVVTEAGLHLDEANAFEIEQEPFNRAVEKIVRGLYAHAYSSRLPAARYAEVFLNPPQEWGENHVVRGVVETGVGRKIGMGVFDFRMGRDETRDVALCVLWFFDHIVVLCNIVDTESAPTPGRTVIIDQP